MQRDEAVALIKAELKRANTSIYDSIIVDEMRFVQKHILEKGPDFPWFLTSPFASLTLTPGQTEAALPPDFLAEIESSRLRLVNDTDGTSSPMFKGTLDELLDAVDSASINYLGTWLGTEPLVYAIENTTLHFLPKCPDDGKTRRIRWKYVRRDTELDSNIENEWLKWASDVVIGETGQRMAGLHLRDPGALAVFKAQADRGWKALWEMHEERKNTNISTVMQYK